MATITKLFANGLLQSSVIFDETASSISISPTSVNATLLDEVTLGSEIAERRFSNGTYQVSGFFDEYTSTVVIYSAGLFKTTYAGYFADDVSFFATATPTTYGTNPATSVQTTAISEANSNDGSNFSCQWLGYFLPSTTETYTFFTASDDASYVWVGSNAVSGFSTGNAVVNNGGAHAVQERSGTISLTAGVYYPIRIQFGEAGGGDAMTFSYSTSTISKTTNVTGRVFYNPTTSGFDT
jgi:hypothetical protein